MRLAVTAGAFILAAMVIAPACGGGGTDATVIQRGSELANARQSSVDEFFQRRIHNQVRKANVGYWVILFQDEEWVYYGRPRFRFAIFFEQRVVDDLYRVRRRELARDFPGYRLITGLEMRPYLYPSIMRHVRAVNPGARDLRFRGDYRAFLAHGTVTITQDVDLNDAEGTRFFSYRLTFDARTGELRCVEKI